MISDLLIDTIKTCEIMLIDMIIDVERKDIIGIEVRREEEVP